MDDPLTACRPSGFCETRIAKLAPGVLVSEAPYDVEDAELLAVAKQMIATLQARHAPVG